MLPDEASLTKKIARPEYCQYGIPGVDPGNSHLHLARLNKVDGGRRFSLEKECNALSKFQLLLTLGDVFEHTGGIESEVCGFKHGGSIVQDHIRDQCVSHCNVPRPCVCYQP